MPAPPRPRQSPPWASAASSAASRRSASEPVADENASPIAPQTRDDSTRFACATQSVPLAPPADGTQCAPVHWLELPSLDIIPTWRKSASSSSARRRASASAAETPSAISSSPRHPYRRSVNDWVATAPTPGHAQATAAAVLNDCDCTATPISPLSGSRPTIEYVTAGSLSPCVQRSRGAVSRTSRRRCTALRGSRPRASMALPRDPTEFRGDPRPNEHDDRTRECSHPREGTTQSRG